MTDVLTILRESEDLDRIGRELIDDLKTLPVDSRLDVHAKNMADFEQCRRALEAVGVRLTKTKTDPETQETRFGVMYGRRHMRVILGGDTTELDSVDG